MIYHRYRFGFKRNVKVFLCRLFGHRINENPAYGWCERCGMVYEECYHPLDYFVESGKVKVPEDEKAAYLLEQEIREQKFKLDKTVKRKYFNP